MGKNLILPLENGPCVDDVMCDCRGKVRCIRNKTVKNLLGCQYFDLGFIRTKRAMKEMNWA